MKNKFKLEIISPEKNIFSNEAEMVTIPSYEGDISLLQNHISIITFLRPGIVTVQKDEINFEKFFVEDGIVEFFNNCLVVLSASAINIKNLSMQFVDNLNKNTEKRLSEENVNDHDRYILNHKLEALKTIRI